MNHLRRHVALFLLAATCSLAAEAQTTIGFGNGPGITTGDALNNTTLYEESGFTLTTSNVFQPDVRFQRAWDFSDWARHIGQEGRRGTLFLTASDGSSFRLQGFDVAASCFPGIGAGESPFTTIPITGRLGGSNLFSFRAVVTTCPPISSHGILFTTMANPFSDVAVDEIVFDAGDFEIDYVDNIVLTAVPEPSMWALVLAGVGATAALRRRRA